MKIILGYIFRSILERRLRTILIISAIMISSGMFFASISISGTLVNIQMAAFRQNFGYTDIIIHSRADSPSRWFYMDKAEKYSKEAEYVIGEMNGYGTYINWNTGQESSAGQENSTEQENSTGWEHSTGLELSKGNGFDVSQEVEAGTVLRGIDITELQKLTPFTLEAEKNLYPFKGMKAVISSDTAEKYGIQCGKTMLLEINGSKYRFIICGIIRPTGTMPESRGSFCTILPLNTLNSLYDARGKVDMIYCKLLNPAKKQRLLFLLSRDYSRYTVEEPFTEWELKRETNRIATPVVIVTVILSFMCIYIIHTTFKIVVLERLPVIGTFRSIGAKKRTTNLILLMESLVYGITGGITGCGFGIGLLYVIAVLPETAVSTGANVRLDITLFQLAGTFGIALLLSAAGSIITIMKTVRISIKDIILGTVGSINSNFGRNTVLGSILLCLSFAVPMLIPPSVALLADTICMTMILLAGSLLLPFIMEQLLKFLNSCCSLLLGNLLQLAVMLLRNNKNAHSGVSMLMIGISSLYMISTLNWSQLKDTAVIFERNLYELTMSIPYADKTTLGVISQTDGVKGVLGNYYTSRIGIEGYDDPIWHLQGIDTVKFPSFQQLKTGGEEDKLLTKLDKGRYIMLTNALKIRLNVKTGDCLLLQFPSGEGGYLRKSYKIIGFFDTMIKGKWSYALISDKNFKADVHERFFGPLYIQTNKNPTVVMNSLKAAFSKRKPEIEMKEEVQKADLQSNGQLFFMLQGFTVMTLITGTFGIMNNLIIDFLKRKRQFAMLRSCGMSRQQMRHVFAAEAFIQGVVGSVTGILIGLGTTRFIVPQIIHALNIESSIYFSPSITAICFSSGVLAYILASAGIIFKATSMEIIPAIKQE